MEGFAVKRVLGELKDRHLRIAIEGSPITWPIAWPMKWLGPWSAGSKVLKIRLRHQQSWT